MKGKGPAPAREIELDFVRGVAILLVMNFHYQSRQLLVHWPFLLRIQSFGWTGVDVFFVLSGFLVGGLLLKEWKRTGKVEPMRFLKRRAFKIWPAYYLFLLVAAVIHIRPLNSFLWQNLLNIQNYIPSTIAHTWSLAIEEHFYLGLAALVWLFAKKRWRVSSLLTGCAVAVLAVEVLRALLIVFKQPFYFYTHTRIDALLLGVMLAALRNFYPASFEMLRRQRLLLFLVLAAALIALYVDRDAAPAPQYMSSPFLITLVDYGSAALLLLLYRPGSAHSALYRVVARMGIFSYGIYLWHVSVLRPVDAVLAHIPRTLIPVTSTFLPYMLAIALGIASTKAIELPMLRIRERWVPSRIPEPAVPVA